MCDDWQPIRRAGYLRVPAKTLYTWRYKRVGPREPCWAPFDTAGKMWRRGSRRPRPPDDSTSYQDADGLRPTIDLVADSHDLICV